MLRVREDRRQLSRRVEIGRIVVGAAFALLATAYWVTQIVRGDYFFALSENNRIRSVKMTAPRGYVFDRHGSVLVENEPSYSLQLYRREAKSLPATEQFAVSVLRLPLEQVHARVARALREPEFLPVPVAENLGIQEVAAIEARSHEHPEYAISISQRRRYAHSSVASHLLGYLAEATPDQLRSSGNAYSIGDWIGQKGIESSYERLLAGVNGERRVVVDSHGREMAQQGLVASQPGQNLFLAIDLELQKIAEEYFHDRVGSAVALDPRNGEILALVSSPAYDPNSFTRRVTAEEWNALLSDPDRPLQNRAIQNTFSPGSVFKVFLAYGALALGAVDPDARIFCPGYASYYGRTFHCHKKGGHGSVNLREAIKVSCDVYFYNLGRRLGVNRIAEIARSFGFGEPTGIDLAYEKSGLVPSEEWALTKRKARWYPSETISVAIGQGPVLVTPLQIARAIAGLAMGGTLPPPHLFLASQDPRTGQRLEYRAESKTGMTLPPEKAAIVKSGMWAVMNEPGGTAYASRVPGLGVAGKTGTVQVVGRDSAASRGKGKIEDHAWFASFAPVEDPRLVVVVFVEHGGHGGSAAAPLAKQLFARYFGKEPAQPAAPPVSPVARAANRAPAGAR